MILLASAALAQTAVPVPEVNSQLYRFPVDSRQTLWTDDAGTRAAELTPSFRVGANYMNAPLRFVPADGADPVALVDHSMGLNVLAGATNDRMRLGVDIPLVPLSSGTDGTSGGIGDLAGDGRLHLFDGPLGLALGGRLTLPTASVPGLGAGDLTAETTLIADMQPTDKLLVAANIGPRFGPTRELSNVTVDEMLVARLGAGYALTDDTGLSADLAGQTTLASALTDPGAAPAEILGGGWKRLDDWVVRGGLGTGITNGLGAPRFRAVVTIGYEPRVEAAPTKVRLSSRKLNLSDRVHFETGSATIQAQSYPVLDDVAEILRTHPEITKLRIEGHTDSRGSEQANQTLSEARARSVRIYLINRGITGSRLVATGYGESRPIDKREIDAAWEKNRRVDFVIEERSR